MAQALRIGMVGLDTSHVIGFTKLLHDEAGPHHIAGAKVTTAFPGGSPDFALSHSRVGKFTEELRDKWGVKIVDSPEAVAEAVDVVFIESVDGRVHLDQFRKVAKFNKPTFIDKPFATSLADAREIAKLARERSIPIMSASSLRYWDVAVAAIGDGKGIVGCDVFGPMLIEPTQGGLFWYGIHTVEMVMAAMGVGCGQVQVFSSDKHDVVVMTWRDGRVATLRGLRDAHSDYGMTIHTAAGARVVDASKSKQPFYAGLVQAILRSLPAGKSDIPIEQTLEIIAIIEAANKSRETGQAVPVATVGAI